MREDGQETPRKKGNRAVGTILGVSALKIWPQRARKVKALTKAGAPAATDSQDQGR